MPVKKKQSSEAAVGCQGPEQRSGDPSVSGAPLFVEVAATAGLDFVHRNGATGRSASATVAGSAPDAFACFSERVEVTYIALEYGTRSLFEVLTALRADNWLHAIPSRETHLRAEIKQQIRDAFYVDPPAWKSAVYGRAADFLLRAGRGLSSG